MGAERDGEELPSGPKIATPGDVDVDDLAVLIDGSVHAAPSAGTLGLHYTRDCRGARNDDGVASRVVR
jgi:hypothetical protein